MVFNSLTFLAFLSVVLALYYCLKHRFQNWMLLVASYIFYGWWDPRFLGLLLFTTLFDYFCALWIDEEPDPKRRKFLLASSMTVNLGVLCIFKYFGFFEQSLQAAFAHLGVTLSFPILHVVLPVGISFYTFLSMSYTIDVYRGELKPARNPLDFMLYVAFFPHLVAGPIVRASLLLPQCQRPRKIVPEEVANGIWLILMGYLKKVVIADRLGQITTWGFSGSLPALADANFWLVIYAFAFQIYGDFAGYSDIARGLSKLMGFELVENFRAPYLVTNPAAFWSHWHISLSTWLRDYLYIPLGGNRYGRMKTYRNLMLTMLLGGLWHGAGVAYVLWGLYHGGLLACQRLWNDFVSSRFQSFSRAEITHPLPVSTSQAHAVMQGPSVNTLATASVSLAQGSSWTSYAESQRESASPESVPLSTPQPISTPSRPPSGGDLMGLVKRFVLIVVFFHITCLGWLLFRAGSLAPGVDQFHFVLRSLESLVAWPARINPIAQAILVLGCVSLFFQWKFDEMNHFSRWRTGSQVVAVILALAAILSLGVFE